MWQRLGCGVQAAACVAPCGCVYGFDALCCFSCFLAGFPAALDAKKEEIKRDYPAEWVPLLQLLEHAIRVDLEARTQLSLFFGDEMHELAPADLPTVLLFGSLTRREVTFDLPGLAAIARRPSPLAAWRVASRSLCASCTAH